MRLDAVRLPRAGTASACRPPDRRGTPRPTDRPAADVRAPRNRRAVCRRRALRRRMSPSSARRDPLASEAGSIIGSISPASRTPSSRAPGLRRARPRRRRPRRSVPPAPATAYPSPSWADSRSTARTPRARGACPPPRRRIASAEVSCDGRSRASATRPSASSPRHVAPIEPPLTVTWIPSSHGHILPLAPAALPGPTILGGRRMKLSLRRRRMRAPRDRAEPSPPPPTPPSRPSTSSAAAAPSADSSMTRQESPSPTPAPVPPMPATSTPSTATTTASSASAATTAAPPVHARRHRRRHLLLHLRLGRRCRLHSFWRLRL